MPATHHVFVYPDPCSFRVAPPHLLAGRDDTITFHTNAAYLAVFFPPGAPFEFRGGTQGGRGWTVLDLTKGASVTISVAANAAPGAYPYAVYCIDESGRLRDFAKGGSEPEILIYE